ncbi:putative acetyltransferase [Okibacterium sp. HSC-33S16]|uniref:GNAT family N-acetyltransferase n=1 Tax=Okibacterium sp. HSC-33S16 TaxID=2910965 RepID=UPI0020A19847|nr:GNAT family N-acetyltransferase [Okibacterium sp. HSC-33S16]MCP2031759.1 putative acetyltransferase [Okibacterium sp. HSC-33S16]
MSTLNDDYDIRTFPATSTANGASGETAGWVQAETQGFHGARLTDDFANRMATRLATDDQLLTGAYPPVRREPSLPAEYPVATFASFEKTINVGAGRLVPSHLISSVTVRPTHRRKGLLRTMMTDSLTRAHQAGLPIAALTASEATIYRRFGFGPATWAHGITVATDARFRLLTTPTGSAEWIDARELVTLGPAIFAAFHARQTGSVERHVGIWERISGLTDYTGAEDPAIRAAVHFDTAGDIDGFVSYKTNWEGQNRSIEVVDLVAVDDNAYLGLWQYLASIDLIDTVSWRAGRIDNPLAWALADPRLVTVTGAEDWVWLRILDPIAALQARPYLSDGEIVLRVIDELGFAAGTFRISIADAAAHVERADGANPDLECDAWVLGSLYLGGADPVVLRAAGQLVEHRPGAAGRLRTLLASDGPVYGITHF